MKVTLKQAVQHYMESPLETTNTTFFVCENTEVGNSTFKYIVFSIDDRTTERLNIVKFHMDSYGSIVSSFSWMEKKQLEKANIIKQVEYFAIKI